MFVRGHSFARLFYPILARMLEACGKSAWNLKMIAKRQTADVSFHRVCETVTIICLNTL